MSLFAGIYSIEGRKPIDNTLVELIQKTIAPSGDNIETFSNLCFSLVKFDFGAFGESGYFADEEKGIAAIAGEPILKLRGKESYSRFSDLIILSEHLSENKVNVLRSCNGTYAICHYKPSTHCLILATDKLGVRPLYYYYDEDFLYFSNCLKVLEVIDPIPKTIDMKAFVEEQVLGIPLGNKSLYRNIKVLRDGQYLKSEDQDVQLSSYFQWDQLPITKKNLDSLLKECYAAFKSAVISRSKHEHTALSFLSGGLDSRCVVSMLHLLGKEIIAFNSFLPGQKDQILAAQYAKRLGIQYIATQRDPIMRFRDSKILNVTQNIKKFKSHQLVFAGDGGSVGVGFVYMDKPLFDLLNERKIDRAIHYYLKGRGIPQRIIRSNMLRDIKSSPFDGIKEEIEELAAVEPERAFYLFLLRNDQRRHLHGIYENIAQHKIEFLTPFYDSRLLEIIASAPPPLEPFLYHNFYHKWLHLFPEDTRSVPWQTYPGHLPCPLPGTEDNLSQWQISQKNQFLESKPLIKKCLRVLGKKDFPGKYINRLMVLFAIALHSMKIRNYSYIFRFCVNLYEHASKCKPMHIEECRNNFNKKG